MLRLIILVTVVSLVSFIIKLIYKSRMEKALGRKVEDRELTSINAWMQVPAPPAQPFGASGAASQAGSLGAPVLQPARKKTRRDIKLVIVASAVLTIVVGGVGFFIYNLPERTYNRLNPFTPKPPAGSFPTTLAGFAISDEVNYSSTYSSICKCDYFQAFYKKSDQTLAYTLYAFKTPEAARSHLKGRSFIGGGNKTLDDTETRATWINAERGGATIALVAGTNMILLSTSKPAEAIAFENQLPYSAFGAEPPPARDVEELREKPVAALALLDESVADQSAALKKYHEKHFLFTGVVAGTGKTKKGIPFVAIEKPGTKAGLETVVSCSFQTTETDRVLQLKIGDQIQFRGKANLKGPLGVVMIEECRLVANQ